jgi:Aldehyde ferredoxin oxidoreductase, domains 2 & 3
MIRKRIASKRKRWFFFAVGLFHLGQDFGQSNSMLMHYNGGCVWITLQYGFGDGTVHRLGQLRRIEETLENRLDPLDLVDKFQQDILMFLGALRIPRENLHRRLVSRDVDLKVLNGATGWNLKDKDWDRIAERILIMARIYNIREWVRPLKDDVLTERLHAEPLTVGPKKGTYISRNSSFRIVLSSIKKEGVTRGGYPRKNI